jgi:hypothetical protein
LVINATVAPEGTAGALSGTTSGSNNNVSANEEIITTCVEKILEILKEKDAR